MTASFICFVACDTVLLNRPHPLPNAFRGSLCKSFNVGSAFDDVILLGWKDEDDEAEAPGEGIGELPNPVYLPPWEGGKSALLPALAAPRRAK